jgi:transcriptional regulator with XRE-family HTH domain
MTEAELFDRLLRATRKDRKVNLGSSPKESTLDSKHLGRIERGERVPSFELIIALAKLNASPSTFFHFGNGNADPRFLTQQLQALLAKRDAKQLRKAYRVLQAPLEPSLALLNQFPVCSSSGITSSGCVSILADCLRHADFTGLITGRATAHE